MLKNKRPTSVLEIFALGYLFIPVFIFMLSWLKLWISIPVVILVLIALCKMLFDKGTDDSGQKIKISSSFIVCSVICFVLILLLSYFLGAGGFTAQPPTIMILPPLSIAFLALSKRFVSTELKRSGSTRQMPCSHRL